MRSKSTTPNPCRVILIAGLVAGTLDIIAACTQAYLKRGTPPGTVLKYIASAVFGKDAYSGGMIMSAWGLFFHYLISLGLAAFFVFLYQRWTLLSKNIVLSGLLYGIFAWVVTTRFIIPVFSTLKQQPFVLKNAIVPIVILMLFIGLPIALIIKKYYSRAVIN